MGSATQELPDITILNDSNFHRWAMEIELTMKGKKLWKYVIDNNINDSEDPSKFMAMAFIVRTVDETNFHRISGCDSAKQMMDKLIQYHRGCSSKSTEGLLQKFYEISWSDDIEATFSEVRRINGELKARGVLKTSSELCSKILSILPTSFNEVKCSVKATKMITGKEITLEQLESLVRSVHKMQKSNDSDSMQNVLALAKKKKEKVNVRCFGCQKIGHYRYNCPD